MTAPAVARFCGGSPDGSWETLSVQVIDECESLAGLLKLIYCSQIPDSITQSESPSVRVLAATY
jgi:hypothetical protein